MRKKILKNFGIEAEQAERSGDYGRVAEIRYGKLIESQKKLEDLQVQNKKYAGRKRLAQGGSGQ